MSYCRRFAVQQLFRGSLKHPALRQWLGTTSAYLQHQDFPSSGVNGRSHLLSKLPHRALVSVKGRDSHTFLQGLVTADVTELTQRKSMFSMLLNAQGRVLYDVILYHEGEEGQVHIECDSQMLKKIVTHLKRYALRSDVTIEPDGSRNVWVAYPGQPDHAPRNVTAVHPDPRISSLGTRILAPISVTSTEMGLDLQAATSDDYRKHRLQLGVAEGPGEVPMENCTPLEYNLDYLNGVSFTKGCYLGQELTARTHHTGVIRKRVVPITFQDKVEREVKGTKLLSASGKNVGKLICHMDGIGLALLRVAEIGAPLSLHDEGSGETGSFVVAHRPSWWPASTD